MFTTEFPKVRSGKRVYRNKSAPRVLATTCNVCKHKKRMARRREDPFLLKARETRRRHARILGYTVEQLERDFGWELERMANDMRHAWEYICPDCGVAFKDMQGLHEMTVDITFRGEPPHWGWNTRLICRNNNTEKGTMPPGLYFSKLAGWREHERQFKERQERAAEEARRAREPKQMPLWEDLAA